MEIQTENLRLILQPRDDVIAMVEAMSPAEREQVSPDWLTRIRASTAADPWLHGFAMVHRETGTAVGSCGFKGPPTDGVVEIAYGVDPEHQGNGYATEGAAALVDLAFGHSEVCLVRAHTLPEANASTRVLTKCGFARIGEVVDPEDGLVWRWENHRRQPA